MSLILLFYGSENAPKRCDGVDDNGVNEKFLEMIFGSKVPGIWYQSKCGDGSPGGRSYAYAAHQIIGTLLKTNKTRHFRQC